MDRKGEEIFHLTPINTENLRKSRVSALRYHDGKIDRSTRTEPCGAVEYSGRVRILALGSGGGRRRSNESPDHRISIAVSGKIAR